MRLAVDSAGMRILADGLAAATVAAIPWSTSATYILLAIWAVVFLLAGYTERWRPVLRHPAAYLPIAFVALALLGTLWAQVSWPQRMEGFTTFLRLLIIPVLFVQFRDSARASWVFIAFLLSCTGVLVVSWFTVVTGIKLSYGSSTSYGVPVRDYIAQSQEFILCGVALIYLAYLQARARRWFRVVVCGGLCVLFLLNAVYVAPSRTALVTIPVLLLTLVAFQCRPIYSLAFACLIVLVTAVVWVSSPKIQQRILTIFTEIDEAKSKDIRTSAGDRLEFWTTSLAIIKAAPVVGHGSGSVRHTFSQAVAQQNTTKAPTTNPHNQTLTIAIQLGLVGVVLLYAMWLSHLLLFREGGLIGWIGIAVVAQNVIGSLFNNHLSDFTQSWIYIFGVGVAGALALRGEREVVTAPQVGVAPT